MIRDNVRNFCDFGNTIRRFRTTRGPENPIPMDAQEHFYCRNLPSVKNDSTKFYGVCHPIIDADFTMEELDKAISRAKNSKSPGPNGTQNEFLKNLPFN